MGKKMELQNVPTKLVNKFNKANIKTVKDLQKNYNRLVNGLGFGGIFVASLLDYMQREGIEKPEDAVTKRQDAPVAKREFTLDPPPSNLLTKAFIKANIYTVDDLQKNYKNLLKASYFGYKRVQELVNYMKQLGINDIPESLQNKYQTSIQNLFDVIKADVDSLVEKKQIKFIYPCNSAASIAFAKLHITNMKQLQKKLTALQEALRNKVVAIEELRDWVADTIKFYSNNGDESQNTLALYLEGLKGILGPGEQLTYSTKVADFLKGKNIAGKQRVNGQAVIQLNTLKAQVQKNLLLSEAEAMRIFGSNIKDASSEEREVLQFLCRSIGLKARDLKRFGQKKDANIIITKKRETVVLLQTLADISFDYLQTKILPVDTEVIANEVRKQYSAEFSDEVLAHLLSSLAYFEKVGSKFTVPIEKLRGRGEIAARILFSTSKTYSTEDLCQKVNKVLRQKGKATNKENQRTAAYFIRNEHIAYNSVSGLWSFKKQETAQSAEL